MQQTICDRCGKPIKRRKLLRKGSRNTEEIMIEQRMFYYGKRELNYDLCLECSEELMDFLRKPNEKLSAQFDVYKEDSDEQLII